MCGVLNRVLLGSDNYLGVEDKGNLSLVLFSSLYTLSISFPICLYIEMMSWNTFGILLVFHLPQGCFIELFFLILCQELSHDKDCPARLVFLLGK